MEAYIARIKECNPILNFMVADRFNEALDEARKIDEMLDSENVPERYSEKNTPYLGVPLSVKEAFSVVGKLYYHTFKVNLTQTSKVPQTLDIS